MSTAQSATSTTARAPEGGTPRRGLAALSTTPGAVGAGLVLVGLVALFYRWFQTQHLFSSLHMEDWGHAYFIPLISGYLIWQRRAAIERTPARAFWPGLAPMLLGIWSYVFFATFVSNHMLQGASVVLTIFGIALTLLGPEMMRHLLSPIGYLFFGITVSPKIMIAITFQLKLIASQGAWLVLGILGAVFGFGVEVEGNQITMIARSGTVLPPLDVADACSGMRMVVAFIALGAAVALLSCPRWWQRVALVLLAVPVALLMNIVRVSVLALLSMVNADLSVGDAHTLIGTLLLIPGLGMFMLVVWILKNVVRPAQQEGAPA